MGTDFGHSFRKGTGLRKGGLGDKCALDSLSPSETIVVPSTQGRISPPTTPDMVSIPHSRQTSTEQTSEAAPEIVVWTEEMDMDSESPTDSDLSSVPGDAE